MNDDGLCALSRLCDGILPVLGAAAAMAALLAVALLRGA